MLRTGKDSGPELTIGTARSLRAATRMLAEVALRSPGVLDATVTLPQFRLLADPGPVPSWQAAPTLGLGRSAGCGGQRLAASGPGADRTRLTPRSGAAVTALLGLLVRAAGEEYGVAAHRHVPAASAAATDKTDKELAYASPAAPRRHVPGTVTHGPRRGDCEDTGYLRRRDRNSRRKRRPVALTEISRPDRFSAVNGVRAATSFLNWWVAARFCSFCGCALPRSAGQVPRAVPGPVVTEPREIVTGSLVRMPGPSLGSIARPRNCRSRPACAPPAAS